MILIDLQEKTSAEAAPMKPKKGATSSPLNMTDDIVGWLGAAGDTTETALRSGKHARRGPGAGEAEEFMNRPGGRAGPVLNPTNHKSATRTKSFAVVIRF